jgi:hypothetical protein
MADSVFTAIKDAIQSSDYMAKFEFIFFAARYGRSVMDFNFQVLPGTTRDLGKLHKKFPIGANKGLGPLSAPHPVCVESHVRAAGIDA